MYSSSDQQHLYKQLDSLVQLATLAQCWEKIQECSPFYECAPLPEPKLPSLPVPSCCPRARGPTRLDCRVREREARPRVRGPRPNRRREGRGATDREASTHYSSTRQAVTVVARQRQKTSSLKVRSWPMTHTKSKQNFPNYLGSYSCFPFRYSRLVN